MEQMQHVLELVTEETVVIPMWEIGALLLFVALCILVRARKLNLLITYLFTVRLSWGFMEANFGPVSLIAFAAAAGIVLLIGFVSLFTDREL
jgi:hypothetical protein